jgi:tRNA A37 threonylcarbamoyladenosine modification protein TsaB
MIHEDGNDFVDLDKFDPKDSIDRDVLLHFDYRTDEVYTQLFKDHVKENIEPAYRFSLENAIESFKEENEINDKIEINLTEEQYLNL